MSPDRARTLRMSLLMFFFWGAIIVIEGFMVPYLASVGYSEWRTGLIMSSLYVVSVFSTPLWGYVADRTDRHRIIVVTGLLASVAAILSIWASGAVFALIMVFSLLYSLTAMSLPALLDSWIMRLNRAGAGISYGLARGFGSLGFALSGAALGLVFNRYGLRLMFPSFAVLMLLVVIVAASFRRAGDLDRPRDEAAGAASRADGVLKSVLANGPYMVLLVSTFFVLLGTRAAVTFAPLRIYSIGGSTAHVGWFQGINAASEIPFMFISALVLRRVRPRVMILVAMMFFTVRLVLLRLAPTPGLFLAAQALQGPSFGLILPAIVHYIDRIAPRHLQSLFQTLAPSVFFGLASVIGSALGGVFVDRFGMDVFYTVVPCVTLVGVVIFAGELVLRPRDVR